LRALAILMVVGIHAWGYSGLVPDRSWGWFLVDAAGVPVFFLVDGFLFAARGQHAFDYSSHLKASAQRLLVPWVLFATFYLAIRVGAEAAHAVPEQLVLGHSWLGVASCLYFSCAALQLYFLLSLFLVRCLAPLARWLAAGPEWLLLASIVASSAL